MDTITDQTNHIDKDFFFTNHNNNFIGTLYNWNIVWNMREKVKEPYDHIPISIFLFFGFENKNLTLNCTTLKHKIDGLICVGIIIIIINIIVTISSFPTCNLSMAIMYS